MNYDHLEPLIEGLREDLWRVREEMVSEIDRLRSDLDNLTRDLRRFGEPR